MPGRREMDEAHRLSILASYDILDTPPEPNFDHITNLAATIFGLPISVLSLADANRHWFKARHGMETTEVPRMASFCDHTISRDGVFVVHNTLDDPRFADAPGVAGPPHFRFYAGAPLIVPGGSRIGSLCLLDTWPHDDFGERQCSILTDLAQTAVELLNARRRHIELARHTEETAFLAYHDPLTGLPNRRQLHDHMSKAVSRLRDDEEIAVLYLDLDHFKEINDRYGHSTGDLLLLKVAERLRANVRTTDKVARLGGDEFAIVQTGEHARRQAAELAERLIHRLSEPYEVDARTLTIGASVGIALGVKATANPDDLVRCADDALYQAKSEGRGRFCFFGAARDNHGPAHPAASPPSDRRTSA
jgi:diguanylate cyclase (GGDEF)-like protein